MRRRPSSPSDREAVRVLAVSDETSDELLASPDLVRSARLILACGDLPFDYLDALLNALEVPLVFVPGNHDPDVSGYRSSRAGLTLRATDAEWSHGTGPEVAGPMLSLVMAMTGRKEPLGDLTGDGLATLRARS